LASESAATDLKHIDALFRAGTATGLNDRSLLDRLRSGPAEEAEAAFAVLVRRHCPRPDLRAGGSTPRLPGTGCPIPVGPGARAAARPAGPPRGGAGDRGADHWPDARLRLRGRRRVLEANDGDGGGPLCSDRDRCRLGPYRSRSAGRRSFASHELASADEMGDGTC
jgi:hypothetical protein